MLRRSSHADNVNLWATATSAEFTSLLRIYHKRQQNLADGLDAPSYCSRRSGLGLHLVLASLIDWKNRMPLFVLEPPVQYVHHFGGPVIERVLPLAEARKACAGMGVRADACGWTNKGACHLVIPRNGPVRDRAAYRRHELAHCNGWDHSHAIAGRQEIEPH